MLVPSDGTQHLDLLVLPETNLILVASVIEPLPRRQPHCRKGAL